MMNIKHLVLATLIIYSINIFAQKNTLIKQKAPSFEVVTIAGEKISLSELKGKVVVLNFWFTTCKPCIKEIPKLNKEFSDLENSNLVFVSLCTDSKDKLEKFRRKMSLSSEFKIVAGAKAVAREYKVTVYPCNMVIDKEGVIKYIHIGYSPNNVVVLKRKAIKELK